MVKYFPILVLLFAVFGIYDSASGTETEFSDIHSLDSLSFVRMSSFHPNYPQPENRYLKSLYLDRKQTLKTDVPVAVPSLSSDFIAVHRSIIPSTKKGLLIAGGILALGGITMANDDEIYNAIQRNRDIPGIRELWKTGDGIERIGVKAVTHKYYFGAVALGYITDNDFIRNTSLDILEASLISTPLTMMMKSGTGRARPYENDGAYTFATGEHDSFFSSHSTSVTQLAVILSHHVNYTPFTVAAYGLAGSVLLQRMTSSRHWPSDVFFGTVWGYITAKGVISRNNTKINIRPVSNDLYNGITLSINLKSE